MLSRTAQFLAWIALGKGLIFAQGSTGAIIGTVKYASGAVLEGAAVSAKTYRNRPRARGDDRDRWQLQLPVSAGRRL